jgi:acetyl-CoA carboxylase biotin carboxylase subunit
VFDKLLVADRGEIALRVIRTCKELGIKTVAVYSEADAHSSHVLFADEDVCIGPPPGESSYRNYANIISAAELTNADAIHPGYGPLAENGEFAELCRSCGICFIGPGVEVFEKMGDKAAGRSAMEKAGVPTIPGSPGPVTTLKEAEELAEQIGYPVRLKAAAGGGGRGMRVVQAPEQLAEAWDLARLEARTAFTSDVLYMERSLESARHIEIQVLGDQHGNVVHLGERECSIQRRHQKLLEESPSPVVDAPLRERLGAAAVAGAKSISYSGAGTVEFLVDGNGEDFYFLEMNKRIQVEHPVTEMITSMDLIAEQIRIAGGEQLGFEQSDINFRGHAIECRINAEDPDRNFMPSAGTITALHLPGGPSIRVDTHIYQGYAMPPYYDSLLAKVIAWGNTRGESIARMKRALEEFTVEGIATTIPFHLSLLVDPNFVAGDFDIHYVTELFSEAVVV